MIRFLLTLLVAFSITAPAVAADEDSRWSPIDAGDRKVQWPAENLAATPHLAEGFSGPLGYRVERYFWRAQKPAGAFGIVVLRDLTGDDHYLSGPVDLMKFAVTVLKGLEAPKPEALEAKDAVLSTASGRAYARRFELGARQCLALGFYAGPDGKGSPKDAPLPEGSIRLDGVYCATAGEEMTAERAAAAARALRIGPPPEAEPATAQKK